MCSNLVRNVSGKSEIFVANEFGGTNFYYSRMTIGLLDLRIHTYIPDLITKTLILWNQKIPLDSFLCHRRQELLQVSFIFIPSDQGFQMIHFQTKNSNLVQVWKALQREMLLYSTAIWNILRPLVTLYGHLVILWLFGIYISPFWYIASRKIWQPCFWLVNVLLRAAVGVRRHHISLRSVSDPAQNVQLKLSAKKTFGKFSASEILIGIRTSF
jgi:hypothetical protein